MIQLFIENNEIEITDDVQIAITKQFEELSNPTTIINDWSKTVSIPFTENNNRIFGHIYDIDKLIVSGNGSVGIYFNPLLKLDFRIVWNGDILITGYAKMNKIKQSKGKGTYEITLFGQLGKIFQEMQKITFDSSDTSPYLIDGSQYVDDYINKDIVYSSWNSSGQSTDVLKKKTDSGYSVTDIIGFAPNNSYSEEFDHKTFQTTSNKSKTFEDTLTENGFYDYTGIEAGTAIPNGMLPREIGEYRSYLQLPFIYWNKLFKIFQSKAESVTGYTFDLDSSWFSTYNPYWYNLVYMLKPFDIKSNISHSINNVVINSSSTKKYDLILPVSGGYFYTPNNKTEYSFNITLAESNEIYDVNTGLFTLPGDEQFVMNGNIKSSWNINTRNGDLYPYSTNYATIGDNAILTYRFDFYDANNNLLTTRKFGAIHTGSPIPTSGYTGIVEVDKISFVSTDNMDIYIPYKLNIPQAELGTDTFYIKVSAYIHYATSVYHEGEYPPFNLYVYDTLETVGTLEVSDYTIKNTLDVSSISTDKGFRSYSHFTLNDLWNKDFNLFGEILKYCKMYRICVTTDDYAKKIYFKPYTKYFSGYTTTDWEDKIDKSKDFEITPITLENKYVLFNYEDSKTKLGAEYKEKYGVNYGEYRLVTDYNFNNETEKLFDKITPSITNTDNVLSWTNLYDYHKIVYSFPAEISVYNKDKDGKQVDVFGAYFFHNGLANFSTEAVLHMRPVVISDDTAFQQSCNTYFYTQSAGTTTSAGTYPALDIVRGDLMCVFNTPKESYTFKNNYSEKSTIYTNFWENYLNERYNVQNKLVTCYVDIRPQNYKDFDFNKFVKVGNQLCMVNKIYDYDIKNNNPTKVDLVTIQDIGGYADDIFMKNFDQLSLSWSSMVYINGTEGASATLGTFTSISDVTFDDGTKSKTINGIQFYINDYNHTINAYNTNDYVDEPDIVFEVALKNAYNTTSFNVTRYSVYPYPYISITDGNGNEVTELTGGSYTLHWECTETDTLDNVPTVSISTTGRGVHVLPSGNWTVEEKMYQDGEDEYFRNMYSEAIGVSKILNGTATFTITDKQGWHQTKTYNVV